MSWESLAIGIYRKTKLKWAKKHLAKWQLCPKSGMQEYSQRQAGVTWAIVLCVLIPIVLVVVFVAFRQFRKQKEPEVEMRHQGGDPVIIKHSKLGSFREPTESDKLKDAP